MNFASGTASRLTKRGVAALVIGGIAFLAYRSFADSSSVTVNYRVTATFVVDQQQVTASKVWSLTAAQKIGIGSNFTATPVRAEALEATLSDGRTAFVLRRARTTSSTEYGGYPRQCADQTIPTLEGLREWQGACLVSEPQFPVIAISREPSDPDSFQAFAPTLVADATECRDVCIVRIAVERTTDPLTTGILERLPWLAERRPADVIVSSNLVVKPAGQPQNLYARDFSTELSAAQ